MGFFFSILLKDVFLWAILNSSNTYYRVKNTLFYGKYINLYLEVL